MICPHCDYKYGYEHDDKLDEIVKFTSNYGDFWKSLVPMQRACTDYYSSHETINIYACPSCNKLFTKDD